MRSGAPLPVVPPVPAKAATPLSVPTLEMELANLPALAGGGRMVTKPVQQELIGRRAALVIENSAYRKVPELINPKWDAEVVAATLRMIACAHRVALVGSSVQQQPIHRQSDRLDNAGRSSSQRDDVRVSTWAAPSRTKRHQGITSDSPDSRTSRTGS